MLAQPDEVIGKALDNLRRWLDGAEGKGIAAYGEWQRILLEKRPDEIAELLVSDSHDAIRLRQSSPFAGVLGAREIWQVKRDHEAA